MSVPYDDLKTRRRALEAHHLRSLEMQQLDALLRIEEVLEKLRVDFLRTREQQMAEPVVEGEVEDIITNVKPQDTPFQKAFAAKPKGARKVDRL